MRRAAPSPERPFHRRDRGWSLGLKPLRSATLSFERNAPSGVNLGLEAPGRLRPRLETMRHWTTSFQLIEQDPQYGGESPPRQTRRRAAGLQAQALGIRWRPNATKATARAPFRAGPPT